MEFIETAIFTKRLYEVLTEDEYSSLQEYLSIMPDAGDIIPGTNGLRKLRFQSRNKGKRGGTRVIYYWLTSQYQIFLMAIYAKNQQIDLTEKQKLLLYQWLKDIK